MRALGDKVNENCTGRINLSISFYENLNEEQFEQLIQTSNGSVVGYPFKYYSKIIEFIPKDHDRVTLKVDFDKIKETAELGFVKKFEIEGKASILGGPGGFFQSSYDPFANIICN